MSEDAYNEYVRLMTDRSLTPQERRAELDRFKAERSFAEWDRIRVRYFG